MFLSDIRSQKNFVLGLNSATGETVGATVRTGGVDKGEEGRERAVHAERESEKVEEREIGGKQLTVDDTKIVSASAVSERRGKTGESEKRLDVAQIRVHIVCDWVLGGTSSVAFASVCRAARLYLVA